MKLDLHIRKTLGANRKARNRQQGSSTFELNVELQSSAARIVIVGPSGSGKSLTLQAIAGLLRPDQGKPVAGARVRVLDCTARVHDEATTGSDGIARFGPLPAEAPECNDGRHGYFFIARASDGTTRDLAFTWSHWDRGIEAWRFGVPTLDANDDLD